MVSPDEKIIAADLAGAIAKAGVDPTLGGRALQDALRCAIATRRGYCSWDADQASWLRASSARQEETIRPNFGLCFLTKIFSEFHLR